LAVVSTPFATTSYPVDVDEIRTFAGTLMRKQLPGSAGIFVTLSKFTGAAAAEGHEIGLQLIDGVALYQRLEKVKRPGPPCPNCSQPMRLDKSIYGWWFRCDKACGGKQDLGPNPGAATEFLLEK